VAGEHEIGRTHANGTMWKAASWEHAAIVKRRTRLSWSTAVDISMVVLVMMMSMTAGAAKHGRLTQQMTRSLRIEWDTKQDKAQIKPKFQTWNVKINAIDTLIRKVDLFQIEVLEW